MGAVPHSSSSNAPPYAPLTPEATRTNRLFTGLTWSITLTPTNLAPLSASLAYARRINSKLADHAMPSARRRSPYLCHDAPSPRSRPLRAHEAIVSTAARASAKPKFAPWPASGCTARAASPASTRRGAVIRGAMLIESGKLRATPTASIARGAGPPSSAPFVAAASASPSRLHSSAACAAVVLQTTFARGAPLGSAARTGSRARGPVGRNFWYAVSIGSSSASVNTAPTWSRYGPPSYLSFASCLVRLLCPSAATTSDVLMVSDFPVDSSRSVSCAGSLERGTSCFGSVRDVSLRGQRACTPLFVAT
mmetsp:Transcript_8550/g.19427  ORF Transcript_8550/g.19427 Transcript_8550/m.19427 type:complete len:308 (+) Transcript_8550:109-1032(+)